jgi:hypothetical protein
MARLRSRLAWLGAIVSIALVLSCSGKPGRDSPPTPAPAAPGLAGYQGALPPLPEVQFASARPEPITRAAYEFAARHPEVLRYMPCFCGCERHGHGNNEDCFVARRDANGRPQWNPHGVGCGICIDVAREAKQMYDSGVSLAQIRKAVDAKYRSEYPSSTPTPHPH